MSANAITIAFYVITVVLVIFLILTFLRLGSPKYNQFCALQWIQAMDVVKQGQRYQGSRAIILADIDSRKKGAVGFEVVLAYRTPSRRAFYLSVTSTMGQVTDWNLVPADFDEMLVALEEAGLDMSSVQDREKTASNDHKAVPQDGAGVESTPLPEIAR